MALPNVLTEMLLMEAGARAVAAEESFPALRLVFFTPAYVMLDSRCLLNKVVVIVGTGLDQLMTHNPDLRSVCLRSAVQVTGCIAYVGENLLSEEDSDAGGDEVESAGLETAQTRLM